MPTWVSAKPVNASVSHAAAKRPGDGAETLLGIAGLDTAFQRGGAGGRNVCLGFKLTHSSSHLTKFHKVQNRALLDYILLTHSQFSGSFFQLP